MKRQILFLLILISFPLASAYSFEEFVEEGIDFFSEFFAFTGMAVLEVNEEKPIESEKFEKISVPEPKKVEVEKEEVLEEHEQEQVKESEFVEEKPNEVQKEDLNERSKSSKPKFVPECSDYLDNNVNYYKRGSCNDNTKKLLSNPSFEDYCSGDGITLMEYFCNDESKCESSWYVCPNGCENGQCLSKKKEEFKPDLKILSVNNDLNKGVISIKNKGSKGTYFNTKLSSNGSEEISEVNYYLDPDEVIRVELDKKIVGEYAVELLVDNDLNEEDNKLSGKIEEENRGPKITGKVTSSERLEESVFVKFFKFLRNFF